MISDLTKNNDSPIWGDAIGIIIGCLLGIVVPKMIMGNNSETSGFNNIRPKHSFLGDMTNEEIKLLINYDLSLLD